MRVFLTKEQAKCVLNKAEQVGFKLSLEHAHALIDKSYAIELTGEIMRSMGYGIMVFCDSNETRSLRTDENELAAIERELVESGREHEAAPDWWKRGEPRPIATN